MHVGDVVKSMMCRISHIFIFCPLIAAYSECALSGCLTCVYTSSKLYASWVDIARTAEVSNADKNNCDSS